MSQTHEKPGPELAESSQEQVLTNGEARNQGPVPTWDEAVIENGKEYAPPVSTVENRTETRYMRPIQQTSVEYSLYSRQWVCATSHSH